jgi:hypothetical protein
MVDNIYVNVFIQRDYNSLIGLKFITVEECIMKCMFAPTWMFLPDSPERE